MSKELLLIFLYDCELCKSEEDDPQDAIIYFYPTWVNGEQRHALCSQLMGVAQFCTSVFSVPSIISLQSGKFAIRKMGRYALVVGTDRNIPDMVLKTRSETLYKLIRLFHYDIDLLQSSLSEDDDCLTDRFSQLLQVYLPILQYATNTFGNIPTLKIPKSTSTLYLEAINTLESFQSVEGVLGGALLYQNKVVATQMSHSLTKQLVVTDPYRIKLPAQNVTTPFHLPHGVQLLVVYVDSSEAKRLRAEVAELHAGLNEIKNWKKENENNANKTGKGTKEGVVSGMKRELSRIFTAVPEESNENTDDVPDLVKDAVKARQLARMETIVPANFVISNPPKENKSQTTDDMHKNINIPIRYFSLGLPLMKSDWCDSPKQLQIRPYYNTICDPKYPLFKMDGLPASYQLFNSRITSNYENLKTNGKIKNRPRPQSIALKTANTEKPPLPPQKAKRQFSLPLNKNTDCNPLVPPRGIPLTPLMAKLSLLAQEENLETPFSSKPKTLKTPSTVKTPFELANCFTPAPKEKNDTKTDEDDLEQLVLYVFGHDNTSLLLLIENSVSVNPDHVHSLWEKSMNSLQKVEERLHKCLDHLPIGPSGEYSYAVVDPNWGPIERGGAYQPHQLELLTTLHFTLNENPMITDIIIRGEDTVSYGYQCARTQIFYQQNCTANAGVPTPADVMGILPTKAKRTLERDHGIIIL